jgi:hypothetical protein
MAHTKSMADADTFQPKPTVRSRFQGYSATADRTPPYHKPLFKTDMDPEAEADMETTFAPVSLIAHKDPDTLSWSEAMADTEHRDKWIAAARAEVAVLEANKTWVEVPKSSAKGKIIPGTWIFRRK